MSSLISIVGLIGLPRPDDEFRSGSESVHCLYGALDETPRRVALVVAILTQFVGRYDVIAGVLRRQVGRVVMEIGDVPEVLCAIMHATVKPDGQL